VKVNPGTPLIPALDHVIPSGEYIIPLEPSETATNSSRLGDQATEFQFFETTFVPSTQVSPSFEYLIRLEDPTATNLPNPEAQVTEVGVPDAPDNPSTDQVPVKLLGSEFKI
jgi:hypothetical protein